MSRWEIDEIKLRRKEGLGKNSISGFTLQDIDFLISEVERLEKENTELSEPMPCGHYGANLQPDDSNIYVCMVCGEMETLLLREKESK